MSVLMKKKKFILEENQADRDAELSEILSVPLEEIEKYELCAPDAIRIFGGDEAPENLVDLYKDFKYLNLSAYYRTLMMTSAERRHPNLIKLIKKTKNKIFLDYGSGVGTHSIALMQRKNRGYLLDVDGPLLSFAKKRIERRFGKNNPYLLGFFLHDMKLPQRHFDLIICCDVLEHVPDPMAELERIRDCMKPGAMLHLDVSTMVKPSSGHFKNSIEIWLKSGNAFMDKYFTLVKPTIYRRKKY